MRKILGRRMPRAIAGLLIFVCLLPLLVGGLANVAGIGGNSGLPTAASSDLLQLCATKTVDLAHEKCHTPITSVNRRMSGLVLVWSMAHQAKYLCHPVEALGETNCLQAVLRYLPPQMEDLYSGNDTYLGEPVPNAHIDVRLAKEAGFSVSADRTRLGLNNPLDFGAMCIGYDTARHLSPQSAGQEQKGIFTFLLQDWQLHKLASMSVLVDCA
jgi:hypothetical protein